MNLTLVLALAVPVLCLPPPSFSDEARVERQSRAAGVAFLRRHVDERGTVHPAADDRGPMASAVALALVRSGLPFTDPKLRALLGRVREQETSDGWTASIAFALMAAAEVGRYDKQGRMAQLAQALAELQVSKLLQVPAPRFRRDPQSPFPHRFRQPLEHEYQDYGGWPEKPGRAADVWHTFLSVWALHSAAGLGAPVAPDVFGRAVQFLTRHQDGDGAWGLPIRGARGDATAGAVAALLLLDRRLPAASDAAAAMLRRGAKAAIDAGLRWLEGHLELSRNPGAPDENHVGWLLALDVLVSSHAGARVLREDPLHPRIVEALLKRQARDGGWRGAEKGAGTSGSLRDTAYALMILGHPAPPEDAAASVEAALAEPIAEEALDAVTNELVLLGPDAIPHLIMALWKERRLARRAALDALQRLTSESFGVDPDASPDENREAVARWQHWWLSVGRRRHSQ